MYWHVTFTRLSLILAAFTLVSLSGCASLGSNTGQPTDTYGDSPYNDTTTTYPTPSTDTATYHTVQPGETLYGIATRYGRNYQDIAAWNSIPPPYIISVGQHLLISAPSGGVVAYPSTPTPTPVYNPPVYTSPTPSTSSTMYHTVQQGESLYGISTRYGQNFRDVAAWNNIPPPYTLSIGQQLVVSPPTGATTSVPVATTPVYTPPVSTTPTTSVSYHTVGQGDTLYNISKRYGRSVNEVAAWNNLAVPYTLSLGMRLIVSPPGMSASSYSTYSALSMVGSGYHVVAPGETVYRIAKMYGYTVDQIAAWNGLYPPYSIQVGQRLRVSPSGVEVTPSFSAPTTVASTTSATTTSSSLNHHVVQPGENLQVVANKYGVTTHELIAWNGIGSPYTIYPHQELLVAPPN